MTIKFHLFLSFLTHAILLFYLLSLPLYRGSFHFGSVGDIFVHLTSQDIGPKQSVSVRKSRTPLKRKKSVKIAQPRKSGNKKTMPSVQSNPVAEKHEQIPEHPEHMEIPKNGIFLKEEIPVTQVKEVKNEKQPEPKMAQKEKPPQVEPLKAKETVKVEETPKAKEIEELKSTQSVAKVSEVKSELETEKLIEKKTAYENVTVAKKASEIDKGPFEKKEQPQKEEVRKDEESKSDKKPGESVKTSGAEKPLREIASPMQGQTTDSVAEKANIKAEVPSQEGSIKKSSSAKEPKGTKVINAAMTAKKMSEGGRSPVREALAAKKDLTPKKEMEEGKAEIPAEGPLMIKALKGAHSKAEEAPAMHLPQTGISDNTIPASIKPLKVTEAKSGIKDEISAKGKNPPVGIPVPDILLLSDIKIEILMTSTDVSNVSCYLFRRPHPGDTGAKNMKQKEIAITKKDMIKGLGIERVLRIAKADKGIYTFVIRNTGNATTITDIAFHFFEKKKGEKDRDFKSKELLPNAEMRFKFVFPEAIFWDDESYFTGTIETSDSMTKFNDKAGLIWKEEKE
jgi:hypothetical protein